MSHVTNHTASSDEYGCLYEEEKRCKSYHLGTHHFRSSGTKWGKEERAEWQGGEGEREKGKSGKEWEGKKWGCGCN